MTCTVDKLTIVGIEKLIKACSKNGVERFRYGDLEFSLHTKKEPLVVETSSSIPAVPEPTPQELEQADMETIAIDEFRRKDDEIAQMMIEDPELAERLIVEGDLQENVSKDDINAESQEN